MVTNDKGAIELKHSVIEKLARLQWADNLNEETMKNICYEISPGPHATWRCCVYKEREILKWRIHLSMGLDANPRKPHKNVIQVIEPACEECPLSTYTVTDNCRLCLGKACQNSCRFGAISMTETRAHIDPNKCKECGMCASACPYGAIAHLIRPCRKPCPVNAINYDENGICQIDEEKCIRCGQCIHSCPFGAIASKVYVIDVIKAIQEGKEVIAMCAPAIEGQFGKDITMASVKVALKKLGFADMVEVGLGGDMTAAWESAEWSEARKEGKKVTTSCCPAFINMMMRHFPDQFHNNMSETVSPMCAVSRYLKATHPGCVTVFIGPCMAKKSESKEMNIEGNADYVLSFGEMQAMLRSKDVELEPVLDEYQEASIWGKSFASSGGVANAVMECMRERGEDTTGIKLRKCSGGKECFTALTLLKMGKLPEEFVEGMVCDGGCVGGPSKHKTEMEIRKARQELLDQADDRKVLQNLKKYPMDKFSMHRDGSMSMVDLGPDQ
ncbi:MAG: 4Fe-4S dicluster domain-containing protein [Oribacterium sp.]|jgi:[FeFe] hydrogenase (group B1/B3)|nr:4Fe-4S dicluster domain-containing protein [Oribacterium sp.]